MICFGHGEIDWNAVSAVGTLLATFVALLASWLALKAPEWARQAERKEATSEIISATRESLALYDQARSEIIDKQKCSSDFITDHRIRAAHLHETLNRLMARPALSDGPIAVGAGAMSVLAAIRSIETAEEIRRRNRTGGGRMSEIAAVYVSAVEPAKQILEATAGVVRMVEERVTRVEHYADTRL